jgi:hypothetical protein
MRGRVSLSAGGVTVEAKVALITPALFSQPSTRPDGEKRE